MVGPKEKKERALGVRLNLKGTRCTSDKCAQVRRPYPPGPHGKGRRRPLSDFGKQIKEKQKFKLTYLIDENNLNRIFSEAAKSQTATSGGIGSRFIELLESRLDNVVYRLGFTPSRLAARQLVVHGHIFVNKKRVKSPGYELVKGDVITIREESKTDASFRDLKEKLKSQDVPKWLTLDSEKLEGRVSSEPHDVEVPFEISLLVEAFSK